LVINPEDAGGEGIGRVTGIAGFTNGEMPRVQQAAPTLYLARGYVSYSVPLSDATASVDDGLNQVAGSEPACRLKLAAGKFALTD